MAFLLPEYNMYSLQEINSIIQSEGLDKTLKDISPESIKDPTFRDIWEEARIANEKIEDYLEDIDLDDSDDNIFDDTDDIIYDIDGDEADYD